MKLSMPPGMPTCRRVVGVYACIEQSEYLDRLRVSTYHVGSLDVWIPDATWLRSGAMTPDLLTEVETALISPLEAAVMTHWGIQALLL